MSLNEAVKLSYFRF